VHGLPSDRACHDVDAPSGAPAECEMGGQGGLEPPTFNFQIWLDAARVDKSFAWVPGEDSAPAPAAIGLLRSLQCS
jgi:hypothetical protein